MTTFEILKKARDAKIFAVNLTTEEKNNALLSMADELVRQMDKILEANRTDILNVQGKISPVMIDRLTLTKERILAMAKGIRDVTVLPDPVGRVLETVTRPNGLVIKKTSVPIGVVAIIFESRPNVTSDACALALKSGNVCVLRGGKEAIESNTAIINALKDGLISSSLSPDLVNLISDTSRQSATDLMQAVGYVDLLIPRGGKGLISACCENALVPCIHTGTGICHIFVDKSCDFSKALDIIENAKTSRPSVCNAAEVCLCHKDIAKEFLPLLKERLCDAQSKKGKTPVRLRLDEKALKIISGEKAQIEDYDTEFLDYIMAIKVVDDVNEAINHINTHSTGHSECILTGSPENANLFTRLIDSSSVYVNASTRFTDGGEFGLGCEIGISTQKLHARGPMGLSELNVYKYIINGTGQIRE